MNELITRKKTGNQNQGLAEQVEMILKKTGSNNKRESLVYKLAKERSEIEQSLRVKK